MLWLNDYLARPEPLLAFDQAVDGGRLGSLPD